jgi:hypothetical protein
MEKMLIDSQSGKLNIVVVERMQTLPLGTILFCTSGELRKLADLMDDPKASVDDIRKAALNISTPITGQPAKARGK